MNFASPDPIIFWSSEINCESGVIDPPQLFKKSLVKRFASCEEIADLVAYLSSPRAAFVTGANWVIDGGYLAY